ncbi:MAG: MBL fold metallo-hydrolase [Trueperaceae bacterium]
MPNADPQPVSHPAQKPAQHPAPRTLLTQALSDRVHAITGTVNCAIVDAGDGRAVLVDSGQDKDYGKRIRRALEALELRLAAIVATHSHADHFGGNAYLLRQFPDVEVLAPAIEANLIRAPYLEPVYLFHGARPLPELTGKWLQAEPSPVHREVEAGTLELAGASLTLLDTRGHAHRQLSVLVDGVLLAADAVFGSETLERYPLPFAQDVEGQLAAFDVVAASGADVVLPGHGDATNDLAGLAERNRAAVLSAADAVTRACDGGGTEDVLAGVADAMEIVMTDLPRYHLNLCTVSAYLGYLRSQGRVEAHLTHGRLRWVRA